MARQRIREKRRLHRPPLRWLLVVSLLPLAAIAAATPASAAQVEITSAGPLTRIITTDQLNCQVARLGDMSFEFFAPTETVGSCGTLVAVEGQLFGPPNLTGGPVRTAYTPVSQSGVTGAGTVGNPLRIVTVVDLGSTGLRLTQTDSYVVGQEWYRTDVALASNGPARNVILYRAGDCYLQNSDSGYGMEDRARRAVGCSANPNNSPPGRIEQWFPLSPAANYYEASFIDVWMQVGTQAPFPDTCECTLLQDNGAGLSWSVSVPAGGSVTRSHLLTFSPTGATPTGPEEIGRKLKYAALGDSFAAGEGNTPYEGSRRDAQVCRRAKARPSTLFDRIGAVFRRGGRTQGSYPHALPGELLALAPPSVGRHLEVVDENHACAGARTRDLLNRQHPSVAPQVDRLERNTDLMTVTVGGNDIGYSGALALCLIRERCFDSPSRAEIARCESFLRLSSPAGIAPFRCNDDLGAEVRRRIDELDPPGGSRGPLDRVYEGIDEKLAGFGSRSTQRFVVGYPELFPTSDEVGTSAVSRCRSVQTRFRGFRGSLSRSEMSGLNQLGGVLNRAIRDAAQENGFIFVPVDDALDGHELCTRRPWVHGLSGFDRRTAAAFHPTDDGQQSIGREVASRIFPLLDFGETRGGGNHGEG